MVHLRDNFHQPSPFERTGNDSIPRQPGTHDFHLELQEPNLGISPCRPSLLKHDHQCRQPSGDHWIALRCTIRKFSKHNSPTFWTTAYSLKKPLRTKVNCRKSFLLKAAPKFRVGGLRPDMLFSVGKPAKFFTKLHFDPLLRMCSQSSGFLQKALCNVPVSKNNGKMKGKYI
jgi:hypothetical protein